MYEPLFTRIAITKNASGLRVVFLFAVPGLTSSAGKARPRLSQSPFFRDRRIDSTPTGAVGWPFQGEAGVMGKVSYAVLSFGGFLGRRNDHYPLPWQSLKYDTNLGGYITGLTENKLKGAPKYANENSWNWSDARSTKTVDDYYGVAV